MQAHKTIKLKSSLKIFGFGLLATILILLVSCAGTAPASVVESSPSLEQPFHTGHPAVESVAPPPKPDSTEATATLLEHLSTYTDKPVPRELGIRVFPQDAEIISVSNNELVHLTAAYKENDTAWFTTNATAVAIRAEGYSPLIIELSDEKITDVKLERNTFVVNKIGELPTGYQPKSVRFSSDSRYLFTTHLGDGIAVSQYSVSPFQWIRHLEVPSQYALHTGFVESFILEKRRELWISQMTTNLLHIFDLDSGRYLDKVELSGIWPKSLIASPDEDRVYVSCWVSHSVSVIDTELHQELKSLDTGPIPRGLSLTPCTSELLVTRFSDSAVDRIDLGTGIIRTVHDSGPGQSFAMRHIIYDTYRNEYYITAMGADRVYRLSATGEWLGYWDVGDKPNTCDISPDGRWLIVSCRGPNNPDTGYLTKGYEYGKIYFIDLEAGEMATWIWGRDQPTGLDISPDGQYLAFTDFLSHRLELYRLNEKSSDEGVPRGISKHP